MRQRSTDAPEAVLKFAPKDRPPEGAPSNRAREDRPREERARDENDPTDQSGRAVVALLHQAANQSNENCDRAMALAHKLSVQLRSAEDQINQLREQVAHFQNRAARAEEWLQLIRKEIEERLLVPRVPSRPDQMIQ